MSMSDARSSLPAVLDRVAEGDEVTITRHGRPVAVVIRPDTLRVRRADSLDSEVAKLRVRLERARQTPLSQTHGLTEAEAEELVAEIRTARDTR